MNLTFGQKAPEFGLPNQDGEEQRLSDYAGRWVLLYFYPKDDTPGCTAESCGIRDNLDHFSRLGVSVVGVSTDSVKSHKEFADKNGLTFALLSDEKKEVARLYGALQQKKIMGRTYESIRRSSVLIDPNGTVVQVYENVRPDHHAEDVLNDMKLFG